MMRRLSVLALFFATPLFAAEPNIRNVNLRGLQVGGTTTLTIDGDDFGKSPKLLIPFPAKQSLKSGSTDKQTAFEVTLDESVPPGYHNLRLFTDGGVSLPTLIGVEAMPQRPFGPEAGSLPVVLHGTVGGSAVLETSFAGKANQRVMIEVESNRLGGKLRPIIHLYGPKKLQLAWAWPTTSLLGDTRLEATLPEDGQYLVTLHDAEYAAPAPGLFRLKLGEWRTVDGVFPPVVNTDIKTVDLLGGGAPVTLVLPAGRDPGQPLPWPKGPLWSGSRPFVDTSSRPEFVAPLGTVALPGGAFAVSGRFPASAGEERIRVPVKPGTRIRFEVFAERLGSPVDAALTIRNESGAELSRAEDGPGTLDPVLDYLVPDKVMAILACVSGQSRRPASECVYRLVVDPAIGTKPTSDYRLSTPSQRISVPISGRVIVPVHADRRGFAGKIDVTAERLPTGVKLDGTAIPADATGTLVTVMRENAAAQPAILELRGRGASGPVRPVFLRGHPLERLQPWLASELAFAPTTAKAEDFAIDWRPLPQADVLKPAGRFPLPVRVKRLDPALPVRLTLLTSQAPILANNQPDPARNIRVEKPVELAAKVSDGEMTMLLPADLPANAYDIAVQADLLTADKQRVLATAFTPVRKVPVRLPVAIRLQSPARIELKAGEKTPTAIELRGEVVRSENFTGDVTVMLLNPPPATMAPPIVVKAPDTAFVLKATFPANLPATEFKGVVLSASVAPDPKQPNVRVSSRDIELTLNIVGAK